ncbi:hypothetical protein BDU57DRAFT_452882 [Ampelomyces quisqualis]|uniref:Uncharacterized protein n=1 Tax=Ampelomyces quisqualis TaxID=50730 RepID=A0A6A5QF14_AMPQU|nr:hypothetical protein BDU57DRAFT_452882 [Ampelomyces quisqualis]
MCAQRFNPWDLDVSHDEELPDYEADEAPAYEDSLVDEVLARYDLRQYDRKTRVLRACGTWAASGYRITRNSFRVFSKKPEMEVGYTAPDLRQRSIAAVGFDKDGPLPWCPRAHVDYMDSNGVVTVHKMEARNFEDWTMTLDGRRYEWSVATQPWSLVLREVGASVIIARFTYSPFGTRAMRGAEVGELLVFRDGLTAAANGHDVVVCSLMVALGHMEKMGRMYHNPEVWRAGAMTREHIPANGASSASVSMV